MFRSSYDEIVALGTLWAVAWACVMTYIIHGRWRNTRPSFKERIGDVGFALLCWFITAGWFLTVGIVMKLMHD